MVPDTISRGERGKNVKLEDRATLVAFLLLGALTIVLTRLPRLLDGGVVLDGDEAIVGLMAKHVLDGKDIALFFYGQSYGLAIFESLFGALGFAALGIHAASLKLATIALWTIGWIFFTLAADRFMDRATAFGAAFALVFCAAWGEWSMMARGGYVTAFVLTSIALYFCALTAASTSRTPVISGLTGATTILIGLAQPIFAVTFLPFVVFLHYARRQSAEIVATIVGALLTVVVVAMTTGAWSDYWSPDLFGLGAFFNSIIDLPHRLLVFFSGVYYYNNEIATGLWTRLGAAVWCLLLVFTILMAVLYNRSVRQSYVALSSVSGMLIILGLVLCIPESSFGYRYLLPIAVPMTLGLAALAHHTEPGSPLYRFAMPAVLAVLLFCGAIAHVDARQQSRFGSHEDRQRLEVAQERLVEELLERNIHHAYSLDPLLQWNILFTSHESILVRWQHPFDRYPEYPATVDAALFNGEPVALIGLESTANELRGWLSRSGIEREVHTVGSHYFWVEGLDAQMLEHLGFELHRPSR